MRIGFDHTARFDTFVDLVNEHRSISSACMAAR